MDSELLLTSRRQPDDLTSAILDIMSCIQFKFLGLLMIVFLLINSDVFIGRALSQFKNAVDQRCTTSWGVFLQGLFLVIIMICIDVFIKQEII